MSDDIGPCVEWTGAKQRNGYGVRNVARDGRRRVLRAHRLAWEEAYGPIPTGMCVLHRCDNRACVRPSHLFIGDYKSNHDDMVSKGRDRGVCAENRAKTHCVRGHELSASNVRAYNGSRYCIQCQRDRHEVVKKTDKWRDYHREYYRKNRDSILAKSKARHAASHTAA